MAVEPMTDDERRQLESRIAEGCEGLNLKPHPDLIAVVPRYTTDLNAVARAADALCGDDPCHNWSVWRVQKGIGERHLPGITYNGQVFISGVDFFDDESDTPALALCLALDAALGALGEKE